ncbi:MAG: Na/Pi cotransporter family protein [Eubacteriales bacterium]|nr:Na/Pi cotransporter family protein [Eubacteriales bacterium]
MTVYEFFSLMGGVGLFLYGMSIMSSGLKSAAGDKMRVILEHATANRFLAVLVGILVTLLVQSSSATDMMVISFVNSGMMTLLQAIGVIMGANIGTTITAQITAFNLGAYAPFILFIGAIMFLFLKKNTIKYIGCIIMGFGMLFFGISVIKEAIVPLSASQEFISFLSTLENPAIAVVFGIIFTALLQSSSSSVVIFQTFAIQGLISYHMAVYLVIGAAIGSVTPNILASLTTNRNGKRTAVLNLLFNVIRAVIMILLINLFPQFLEFIQNLTPGSIGRQVANTHTIFALLAVLIEMPLAGAIVKLSKLIIPMKAAESKKIEDRRIHYMVQTGTSFPSSVALQQARMEISRMGKIATDSLQDAIDAFFNMDDKLAERVLEDEETVDILTDAIQEKLIALKAENYSEKANEDISQMILVVSDIERISDHAENIVEYQQQMRSRKAVITETGLAELKKLADASMESILVSMSIFEHEDYDRLGEADRLEQLVDDLQIEVVNSHIRRLMKASCDPAGGVIFTDMATDLERCSDHAINVAFACANVNKDSFAEA